MSFKEACRILKRRYPIIVAVFIGAVLLTAVASSLITPTYEAESTLRIKPKKEGVTFNLSPGMEGMNRPSMSTYAEIIKSRSVISAVAAKLAEQGKSKITYENLAAKVIVQPVKETEILKIKVQSTSPQDAQTIANLLVEVFNQRIGQLARSEDKMVREFIGERLAESKKDLDIAEERLQKYKIEQKIVAPAEESKALIERFSALSQISANNNVELAAFQAKTRSNEQKLQEEKVGAVASNHLTRQYQSKLAELEVERVGLLEKYTENHPQVMANQAMIQEARGNLAQEVQKIIGREAPSENQLYIKIQDKKMMDDAELAAKTAQRQAIDAAMAKNEAAIAELPSKEQGLAKVMRDVMLAQELCLMLSKRYEEARISEVMQPTDVQVIDWAAMPERPIKPQKMVNVAVAAILSCVAGIALAIGLELMNKTIQTPEDISAHLKMQLLGSLPVQNERLQQKGWRERIRRCVATLAACSAWRWGKAKTTAEVEAEGESNWTLVSNEEPYALIAEAFRELGNSVQHIKRETGAKTFLLTGIDSTVRKSAVVANLALTLAQAGKNVALLDFDLRKPKQHRIFEIDNIGMTDIFNDGLNLADVMQIGGRKNLHVLPAGRPMPGSSDLFWNSQYFLRGLKEDYDYVLIDGPPVLAVADTCIVAGKVDAVVLVIDAKGAQHKERLQKAKESIAKAGGTLAGAVLDRAETQLGKACYRQYYSKHVDWTDDVDARR